MPFEMVGKVGRFLALFDRRNFRTELIELNPLLGNTMEALRPIASF
jgi:hypothetical protein